MISTVPASNSVEPLAVADGDFLVSPILSPEANIVQQLRRPEREVFL